MNEKKRKEGLIKISEYYEVSTLGIAKQAEKIHQMDQNKVVAGQIRQGKGTLVEKTAEMLVVLACEDLKISKDRYLLTRGPIEISITDTNYIRSRNLMEFELGDYVHRLELDNILVVDGKLIVNIESKSFTEATMLKAIMYNADMVYQYYPDMAFVVLQLENALGGDYAEDKTEFKGSKSAHVIMSRHPNIYLDILTLLDGSRSANRPIHDIEYYKPMNMSKLRKAYSTVKRLIAERVKGDRVFSQKKVCVYNYNMFDGVVRKRSVGR